MTDDSAVPSPRPIGAADVEALARFPEENRSPVLRLASTGVLLYANPAARGLCQLWRVAPGEAAPAAIQRSVSEALADGQQRTLEVGLENRYFVLELCPVVEAGYVNIFGHDVTRRRLAEEELRESRDLLDAVVEHAPLIVALKESQSLRYVFLNRAGEVLLGRPRHEILGRSDTELFGPAHAQSFIDTDMEALRRGGALVEVAERAIPTATGAERWVRMRKLAIPGVDGTSKNILAISEDITERRHAEAERTRLEEELRAAQRLEAIGRLAGGVAHDFNNLMAVILSYTELVLAELGDDDPRRDDLDEVRAAATRAAELTAQLLAFSQGQVLRPVALDVNEVVCEMERLLRRVIGEDIKLAKRLAPDAGLVVTDRGQFEQVVVNLAVNARDAMPNGGELEIETERVELGDSDEALRLALAPGSYVRIRVRDSGCGMNAETQARAFDPFYTTKDTAQARGLGLSTVYGIIKQSGGSISIDSAPNRGATFEIWLPRSPAEPDAPVERPGRPAPTSGGTVLVVEDEPALTKAIARTLRRAGYRVLSAPHAEAALELVSVHGEPIDALLTDVVMPGMNGRELAERLVAERPTLAVVFMSGYPTMDVALRGLVDTENLLTKPFTPTQLLAALRERLDARRLDAQGQHADPQLDI